MDGMFDSLNPYQSLVVIKEDDPERAIERLKEIKTPVKIYFMGTHRNRFFIIIGGDIRKVTRTRAVKPKG